MRGIVMKGALLVLGLSVLIMASGSAVFAIDESQDGAKMNGSSVEMKQTSLAEPVAGAEPDDLAQRELTKEMERPMSVPDESSSEYIMPDRKPGCGTWKNAINHMHCASGYDAY